MLFYVPETKNIPLEEMAKLFGDEVAVYAADLSIDHNTHELVVSDHSGEGVVRVATEVGTDKASASPYKQVEGQA